MQTLPPPPPERESAAGPWTTPGPDVLQRIVDGLSAPEPDEQPAAPERPTIALVTVDAALRAEPSYPAMFPGARIATVRLDGDRTVVMDTDAEWRAQIGDQPALILARMLGAAVAWAQDLDAELLMPTPDVLAALTGTPAAGSWIATVRIPVDQAVSR